MVLLRGLAKSTKQIPWSRRDSTILRTLGQVDWLDEQLTKTDNKGYRAREGVYHKFEEDWSGI
jgi:hypothetical protein